MMTLHELLTEREGDKSKTYLDTKGLPTGGIGHLLTENEKRQYPVGTTIPQDIRDKWFKTDVQRAQDLADMNCEELHIDDPWFNIVMVSVNFQLGNFKKKFGQTFGLLKVKNYDMAILNLEKSAWMKQTPKRVADLIDAINKIR